jgi:hypothetical protein
VDAYAADVKSGGFPTDAETFFFDARSRPAERRASVAAIAHVGGCEPEPDAPDARPAPTAADAGDASDGGRLYSTPRRSDSGD